VSAAQHCRPSQTIAFVRSSFTDMLAHDGRALNQLRNVRKVYRSQGNEFCGFRRDDGRQ